MAEAANTGQAGTPPPAPAAPSPEGQAPRRIAPIRTDAPHGKIELKADPKINPLPGVMERNERDPAQLPQPDRGEGELDELIAQADDDGQAAPTRDAQGRFVPKTGPHQDPTPPAPDPQTPPPAQSRLKFDGREYNSLSDVEQEYKTTKGRLESNTQAARQWRQEAAFWQDVADGKRPHPNAAQSPAPPTAAARPAPQAAGAPAPAPAQDTSEDLPVEPYDEETYNYLLKIDKNAAKIYKDTETKAYAAKVRSFIQSQISTALAPVTQQQEVEAFKTQVAQAVWQLAEQKDGAGNLAYPELYDESARTEIMAIWSNCGLPPDQAKHPIVLDWAVQRYRVASRYASPPALSPVAQAAGQAAAQDVRGQAHMPNSGVIDPPATPVLRARPNGTGNVGDDIRQSLRKELYGDGKNGTLPGVMR
jgi:hypothetical protein